MRRLLLLVSAVVLLDTTFYAAITPLLPYYADRFDLTKASAGILIAAYPAGTMLGSLPGGWLAARAGVKPTVLLGLGLFSVSSLAFAFAQSIVVLDAARFVQGLGGAASWAAALSWLVQRTPDERRSELIATAFGAAVGGALLGPVLGAAAKAAGPRPVFTGVAVLGMLLAAWAWRESAPAPHPGAGLRDLGPATRNPALLTGLALIGFDGLFFGLLDVLAPLRLDELGASATAIGGVFLVDAALLTVASRPYGRLVDRRGPLPPTIFGLAAMVTVSVLLPWPDSAWAIGALVILAGPTIGALWSPGMTLLSRGADAIGLDQGLAFALMNLTWAATQVVGAAFGGALAEATSDAVPYLAMAALAGASLAAVTRRAAVRPVP